MAQTRKTTGWDTRCWTMAILFCLLCGLLHAWGWALERPAFIPGMFGVVFMGPNVSDGHILVQTSDWLANLVFPALLCLFCRRRVFLWGLLVPVVFLAGVILTCGRSAAALQHELISGTLWMLRAILLVITPISLIRWLKARKQFSYEQAEERLRAAQAAASVPQEGTWPQPPNLGV